MDQILHLHLGPGCLFFWTAVSISSLDFLPLFVSLCNSRDVYPEVRVVVAYLEYLWPACHSPVSCSTPVTEAAQTWNTPDVVLLGISCFVFLESFPINPSPLCAGSFIPVRAHSKDCLLRPDDPFICSPHHLCTVLFSL